MPDKLGRWPAILVALALITGAEVSAQVTSESSMAPSLSSRLGSQAALPVSTQMQTVQTHRRVQQGCRVYQTPAVDRQDGRHEASDIRPGFTKHLDRNVPAVLLITMVWGSFATHWHSHECQYLVPQSLSWLQVGALSTAAGAGGGALFVPLFNSLLNFSKLLFAGSLPSSHCSSSRL